MGARDADGRSAEAGGACAALRAAPAVLSSDGAAAAALGPADETDDVWREGGGSATGDTCSAPVEGVGSNYGSRWVDIMAPGRLVWTTRLRTAAEAADGLGEPRAAPGMRAEGAQHRQLCLAAGERREAGPLPPLRSPCAC